MVRQRESGKTIENDCLLGAPVTEVNPPSFEHINQVSEVRLAEIEHFFVSYNAAHGRKFTPDRARRPERGDRRTAVGARAIKAETPTMTRSVKSDPLRVMMKSIGSALEAITKSEAISDEDAHRSRKALKKARAALRLLRPTIGDAIYRRENTVLRNASRTISPLRDAKAQVDIVVSLREHYPKTSVSEVLPFESKLRDKLNRLRRTVDRRAPNMRRAVRILKATRQRLRC